MSQSNSILSILGITDENITASHVEEKNIVKNGVRKKIRIVHGVLTYSRKRCPSCGFKSLIKNGTRLTKLHLNSINGPQVYLYLKKQRYQCTNCLLTCGAHTPLVSTNNTLANGIKEQVIALAKESLTTTVIAKIVGISPSSVERYLYANHKEPYRAASLPKHLSFDEFRSVNKNYSFIAIDAETHKLLTILSSRQSTKICDYFENRYSRKERAAVQTVVIDLNASYQSFVHRLFPNAKLVIDRFHIIQLANRAFDQVRTTTLKTIEDKRSRPYKALKTNWKMFHRSLDKIDSVKPRYIFGINEYMTQQNLIDIGLNVNQQLKDAYNIAHQIQQAIHNKKPEVLVNIINTYEPQNTTMDTTISTLKKNIKSIFNSCISPYSNGAIEGTNRKIKSLKRSCYGFRNMSHFYARILLIVK